HQIRVHLASIGHPLEGDPVYAKRGERQALGRQALHAWKLAFLHPRTGALQAFEAPIPADFRALLEALRK
ncbi:MAG: RNA pseudouridine synthase, partial [Usitatibacter sp.]